MRAIVRPLAWCLALALLALPVVGVLRGWFAATRWPVTRLVVQADFVHLEPEALRQAVRPTLARGFFALDLDAVRHAVAALPWVESVEVRKRWPDTLILRIYERQPFARWNDAELISRRGEVFRASAADVADLPALRGPAGHVAEVVGFYAQSLKAFAGTGLKVSGVSLSERGSWTLAVANGAQIMLGDREQAGRRLQRFLTVYPQVIAGHADGFLYADLRYSNGFAVRWPSATPAVPPPGGTPRT